MHDLLGTFVLRRVKADVLRSLPKKTEVRLYVPMSRTQQQLSKLLLLQDGELLDRMRSRQQPAADGAGGSGGGGGSDRPLVSSTAATRDWNRMQSLLMSLRKCCNHPHLFPAMQRVSERCATPLAAPPAGCTRGVRRRGRAIRRPLRARQPFPPVPTLAAPAVACARLARRLGETLATASGKLAILDRLLRSLFADGHRVVLFSFFTSMLDILEEYFGERKIPCAHSRPPPAAARRARLCSPPRARLSHRTRLRAYVCVARACRYVRLDGSTNPAQRSTNIDSFNEAHSELRLFLCSTRAGGRRCRAARARKSSCSPPREPATDRARLLRRCPRAPLPSRRRLPPSAGGLGINLTSADTVVLYDSDFNPQVDIQAQDRVHRIGQTKPVRIFRLVTRGTVEERIVSRASQKLYLERMVVGGRGGVAQAERERETEESADEVLSLGVSRSEVRRSARGRAIRLRDAPAVPAVAPSEPLRSARLAPLSAPSAGVQVLAMLAFSLSGALDGASLSTADVTDKMIADVLAQSHGCAEQQQLEQITIGVGGIQPMASGGERPVLPNIDAAQLSAGIEPGVLEDLRAFNEEEDGDDGDADARAAAAAAEEEELLAAAGGGRSKRKRTSRFIEVDGFMVLKLNDYTLEDGEPSVFGTELSQTKSKPKHSGRL